MNKQILLINDLAGYGKVALSVMIPVLSKMGVSVHSLVTALVSNTLDYGKFHILDTTEYMKNTLSVWKELDFSFDAISTGFMVNKEQTELIAAYCQEQSENGVTVFCDPIMGDEGSLYPGMTEEVIENMRLLISNADFVIPNYTEAVFLTKHEYTKNSSEKEVKSIIDDLRRMGAGSVIVTSCMIEKVYQVCCYDEKEDRYFSIPFENIAVRFPGTGDIFSAVLSGSILNGNNMECSVKKAMDTVKNLIKKNQNSSDKYRGIEIEQYLEEI